jgi:uncharacterized protein (DUF2252 family)
MDQKELTKTRATPKTDDKLRAGTVVLGPAADERMAEGRSLRKKVPRSSHGDWIAPANRPDPMGLLKIADRGRLAELLPIRYARMRESPFTFFRGAAALMAADLANTPVTGIRVQACGDCHVSNFGGFGSPERRLAFDINDFDETLPAPWEWDLKRLAASIAIAGRVVHGASDRRCAQAARAMVKSYRTHVREYAEMRALDVWYSHIDAELLIQKAETQKEKKQWRQLESKAKHQTSDHVFSRIADVKKGHWRIIDRPPLVYHPQQIERISKHVGDMFQRYRRTLPEERRILLDRYRIVDVARKVVGVGSVGTRCAVALLMAAEDDPLVLQFKEARASVLEPYAGKSRYDNHGERVVVGQRMLQSASDIFLGWTRDDDGRDYYFRQLRDMKMSVDLEEMSSKEWMEYVEICGWALARAHSRTGDAARIAGYLGKSDSFDEAIENFSIAYAGQTERDHAALVEAIREKKLPARSEIPS